MVIGVGSATLSMVISQELTLGAAHPSGAPMDQLALLRRTGGTPTGDQPGGGDQLLHPSKNESVSTMIRKHDFLRIIAIINHHAT